MFLRYPLRWDHPHVAPASGAGGPCATASLRRRHCRRHWGSGRRDAGAAVCQSTPQSKDASSLDVSGAVVTPAFRATPWEAERERAGEAPGGPARVLFVSESGVCRAVLALAVFEDLIRRNGLAGQVVAEAKASRDYNVGDGPEPAAVAVLERAGLAPPAGFAAAHFQPAADIVSADLVLVFDKFTAADVLREVSVFDTINAAGRYALKVRRLGAFHPQLAGRSEPDAQDIPDALYGNVGGEEEEAAVAEAAQLITTSCQGLVAHLLQVQQQQQATAEDGGSSSSSDTGRGASEAAAGSTGGLREQLRRWVRESEAMDWLVPPMLQGSYVWEV